MTALLDRAELTDPAAGELPELGEPGAVGELDADPEPGRRPRRRRGLLAGAVAGRSSSRKSAASKATASTQKRAGGKFVSRAKQVEQMRDEVDAYLKMAALTWSMRDPECATVLNDSSAQIAESLAGLLGRSDWLMERFQQTTMLADVVKLLHALAPLARSVFSHHLAGRGDIQEGAPERESSATVYEPWRPTVPA
jgi:hypothetical protein